MKNTELTYFPSGQTFHFQILNYAHLKFFHYLWSKDSDI